jgi:mRNA interferase RelE/StbE
VKAEFRESFVKDLKGVKDKSLLKRAREMIEAVEKADSLADISNLKKLKGGGNYFRLRVGDYRVGISLENDTIIFVRFLNRKDIYKYFP